MNEINSLRRETYAAASKFHQAHGEFFATLGRGSEPTIKKAAQIAHTAGEVYKASLKDLIEYLTAQGTHTQFRDELSKTQVQSDTVIKELALLKAFSKE
jgi:hypothetical protein